MKKNVKLKARETNATNSDFYNLFRPIAPSIDIIGKVAQVISALTEGITIWYITQSEMAGSSKFISILVSIVAMVLVISVLELGGRKFLQVLTRAIVWKRLRNAWYIALFSIVLLVTVGMGVLSFNLSTNGIHHAFVSSVPVVAHFDDSDITRKYRNSIQEISSRYDSDFNMVKENHRDMVANANGRYDASIDAALIKVGSYERKYKKGEKWAESQADKYRKEANALESKKAAAISAIQADYTKKLEKFQSKKEAAIAAERSRMDAAIAKEEGTLNKIHDSKSKNASFWGGLFSFFVGFSVLLAFVCIVSVEVFRRGSGIEVTYEEEEMDDSILEMIWKGFRTRLDVFFRGKAERFAQVSPKASSGTGIGFNHNRHLALNGQKEVALSSLDIGDEIDF